MGGDQTLRQVGKTREGKKDVTEKNEREDQILRKKTNEVKTTETIY